MKISLRVAALMFTCGLASGAWTSACSSSSTTPSTHLDAGHDAGKDSGTTHAHDAACNPPLDAQEPPIRLPRLDGGVPLAEAPAAEAWALCSYYSHCTPMAPYVFDSCEQYLAKAAGA